MTFHLCCTQPQRTFGFRVFGCRGRRPRGGGDCLPELQQFTRLWAESRHRTPFKRPKLYFIKAHKVTFSRASSRTPSKAPPFAWKSLRRAHTHTGAHNGHYPFVAGRAPLCRCHYPCLSVGTTTPRRSFLHAGGLCLCDNRIYCFIKFVFKLPLPHPPGISLARCRFECENHSAVEMNAKNFGLLAIRSALAKTISHE